MTRKRFSLSAILMLFSRKTYLISPESFKEQFAHVDSASLKQTDINSPLSPFVSHTYKANQLKKIRVTDKDGKLYEMTNSPSLETRITLKDGKRHHFYFDTLVLENDILIGGKSRFVKTITARIPFDDIAKIEIQDGRKRYSYQ